MVNLNTSTIDSLWLHRSACRVVNLPTSDQPDWRAGAGAGSPLLYLAWGARQFGTSPVFEMRESGWVYAVIESGSPLLVRHGRAEPIPGPALVVLGPESSFAWHDHSRNISKMLVWTWREPMHVGLSSMRRDAALRYRLSPSELVELRELHALSRSEIHRGDAHSDAALRGVQALLETRIVRIREGSGGDPVKELVERALQWIEKHLATRQPLARLADFLGVSPATVQRLFRDQLGTTVMKTIAELRRREAERMLAAGNGVTIKEIAYRLGYRHPHDFSRAFRKHTGSLPGCMATRGAA